VSNPQVAVMMCVHWEVPLAHLQKSVESILCQTFQDFKLYAYGDGPLATPVNEYLSALPANKVDVTRCASPRGLPAGLNVLIDKILASSGEYKYVARMDADDISLPERLSKQVAYLEGHRQIGVLGTWCTEFSRSTKAPYTKRLPINHRELVTFMAVRSPLVHPSVMFRTTIFEDGIRYNEGYLRAQDYELWSRLMRRGILFANLPEYLLEFHADPSSLSRRSGMRLVRRELSMRVSHIRHFHLGSMRIYLSLLGFAAVRLAPRWIRSIAYSRLR